MLLERHPHARAVLTPALPPDGRPSHAYLFHGPAGAGKREVAREFAAALLADGAADPDNARERVRRGTHPDLTWVVPSGAAEMLVGDIDQPVVAAASHTPFESRRRVFVIEGADRLIEAAANKMLKTLEEPPPFAHLLLLTDRPANVLPTIASRCQHVRFDARPSAETAASLEQRGIPAPTARACARLALGDGERAEALAFGRGPALRQAAEDFARGRGDRPWTAILAEAKQAGEAAAKICEDNAAAELEVSSSKDRKRVEREGSEKARRASRRAATATLDHALQLVGLWFRDLACVADGAEDVVHHADRVEVLREEAQPPRDFRALVALVDDTRQRLVLNVNEELALEALAYRLRP